MSDEQLKVEALRAALAASAGGDGRSIVVIAEEIYQWLRGSK